MLFSPLHARSANIYTGILAAPGLRWEQSRGQGGLLASLNPSAVGKRGTGTRGTVGHPAVGRARAGRPLLQLCTALASAVAFAQPPPCPAHGVFTAQGSLSYNLGRKVSFLQQTALSEGSFQSEGPWWDQLSVSCLVAAAGEHCRAFLPGEMESPALPVPPGNWGLQ